MKRALPNLVHTYSIVAYDAESNQLGVAVQSHYFGVGRIVTWAEPGVGAVATQSFVEASYGPLGLTLMRAGKTAPQALAALLAGDQRADVRQVAMIDTGGNVAAHTGAKCIQPAGHKIGNNYSAQANLMLNDTVWGAMSEAFEGTKGDIAERMMVALEAAEAEGGDIRGKQSAALLVVSGSAGDSPWSGRLFDIRVDDNPEPLKELRRLMAISRAYDLAERAEVLLIDQSLGDTVSDLAATTFNQAVEMMPDSASNPELHFWYAVALVSAGRVDDSLPIFKQVFTTDPAWRELVPRLVPPGLLTDDAETLRKISTLV